MILRLKSKYRLSKKYKTEYVGRIISSFNVKEDFAQLNKFITIINHNEIKMIYNRKKIKFSKGLVFIIVKNIN